MTVQFEKVTGPVIVKNGASLWLPSNVIKGLVNLGEPDIYTESTAQLYPLGTKLEFSDGRLFRYGKFGLTNLNVPKGRMVVNANYNPDTTGQEDVDGFYGDLYGDHAAGLEYVDLEKSTAYAENFFEDGMLTVFPTGHYCEYRICGSELGNGTYCRIYLDAPLKTAVGGSVGVSAYKSMFSHLETPDATAGNAEYTSVMGVCLCATFTTGSFGWIQRRGRCFIVGSGVGDAVNERVVQLVTDGTVTIKSTATLQDIGYLINKTAASAGDTEYWLQLE